MPVVVVVMVVEIVAVVIDVLVLTVVLETVVVPVPVTVTRMAFELAPVAKFFPLMSYVPGLEKTGLKVT